MRPVRGVAFAAILAGIGLGGCAPLRYRLRPSGQDVAVLPPRMDPGATASDGTFRIPFPGMAARPDCGFQTEEFSAKTEPGALVLTTHFVKGGMDATATPLDTGGASVKIIGGKPAGPGLALAALRTRVEAMEAAGCFPGGQGVDPLARIAQSVPLESADLVTLAFGDTLVNHYVDLAAGDRLQVITPLLDSDGAVAGPTELWYEVRANGHGELEIALAAGSVLTHSDRGRLLHAQTLEFRRRPVARHWRMAILGTTGRPGLIRTNVLIGAETIAALADATVRVVRQPDDCPAIGGEAWCTAPKYGTVIRLPRTGVWIQGKWFEIPRGDTVAQALSLAGMSPPRGRRLRVLRAYGPRLIPVVALPEPGDNGNDAVLRLRLLGGERITY